MRQSILAAILVAVTFFGLGLNAAQAEEVGSPAIVLSDTSLLAGPGNQYPVVSAVAKSQDVTVVRCSMRWCLIAGTNGWLSIDHLSFGNFERNPFHGTVSDIGRGGPGAVCFHDGAAFSGETLCLPSGAVAPDLALLGWDNRISSITIDGNVSVNVCRDRNFTSYCELVIASQSNVNRLLNNAASSWQVW